ncbi:MAG: hypothetical protein WAL83_14985 [Arenicellales bacterium]
MSKHVHSFAERHPKLRDKILELADRSSSFNDVCSRFGHLWDRLNELENEPVDAERIKREVKHLETEMLAMVHDQMRM